MGKITVKHYLNKNLKPYVIDNEKYYKLYFLFRYQNKNTKIKSLLNEELTEAEYSKTVSNANNSIKKRMINETRFIENIIKAIDKANVQFDIKIFNDFLNLASYPVVDKFQKFIKWQYESRFFGHPDLYQQLNIEQFESLLNDLKKFVNSCEFLITDELFFGQLNDEIIVDLLKKHLGENLKIGVWEIKKADNLDLKIGDAIKLEYEQIEHDAIDFLIDNLIKDGGFQMDYRNYLNGNIGDSKKYLSNLTSYLSAD